MTRNVTAIVFLLLLSSSSFSQRLCSNGGDSFNNACILCGNGFVGNTNGFTTDLVTYDFPCGTIENSQWTTIIADATTMAITITSFNCSGAIGVEFALYDQDLSLVSDCFSSEGTETVGTITASDLIVGDRYHLLIDGYNGSSCGFSALISGGLEMLPPVTPVTVMNDSPNPEGVFCVGEEVCFEIEEVPFATNYEWHACLLYTSPSPRD